MADTASAVFFSPYSITEDEQIALCALRDQLGFINNLMSLGEGTLPITASQLHAFSFHLETSVSAVLKAMDERELASRGTRLMRWVDWSAMVRLLGGLYSASPDVLANVTERLHNSVEAEPAMRPVYEDWVNAITKSGAVPLDDILGRKGAAPASRTSVNPANTPASRKRDKLMSAS